MKSILLTRPLLDSLGTRGALRKYGYKVCIEPIFTIKYLHPDLSAHEGGCDITKEMYEKGELQALLKGKEIIE